MLLWPWANLLQLFVPNCLWQIHHNVLSIIYCAVVDVWDMVLVLRLEELEEADRLSLSFKCAAAQDDKLTVFLERRERGWFEPREVVLSFLVREVGKVFDADLEFLRLTCFLFGSDREKVESSSLLVPNTLSLSTRQSWLLETDETLRCLPTLLLYELYTYSLLSLFSKLSSLEVLGPSLSTIVPSLLLSIPFNDEDSLKFKGCAIAIPFFLCLGELGRKSKLHSICWISSECDSWKGQSGWLQLHTSESVSSRSCLTSLRRSVISLVNTGSFFILSGVFTCSENIKLVTNE